MSSFFGRLKSNQGPTSPSTGASPTKKQTQNNATLSPLEHLLSDKAPVRGDGSDKFFGMHNPSNTCYCNSVLQCLYFSELFRGQVVNFPARSPPSVSAGRSENPPLRLDTDPVPLPEVTPISPVKSPSENQSAIRYPINTSTSPAPANAAGTENKESFDYRKKQILAAGPLIRMENTNNEAYGMPESLFTGLKDIFEAIIVQQARMGVVIPSKFLEVLRRNYETYRSPQHQDAHEFLNLLLNEVVEQVEEYSKRISVRDGQAKEPTQAVTPTKVDQKANTSWVHELFEGTLTSETRCLTCETVSQRDEVFLDLSVDLEDHTSVTSCLRRFSQEEMLCERNKFHCDKCSGLQEAEKRMKIKRLPRILALHLKRFKYDEETQRLQKLFHRVVFPFHLRLLNTTDDAEDSERLYELYAIIVHVGSTPFHGHYVSIIKTVDRGWLLFDDELVLPVDANYVRNYFGGDSAKNSACAYVLFFQETTMEAVEREQDSEDTPRENGHTVNAHDTGSPIAHPAEAMGSLNDPFRTPTMAPVQPKLIPAEDLELIATLENPTAASQPLSPSPMSPGDVVANSKPIKNENSHEAVPAGESSADVPAESEGHVFDEDKTQGRQARHSGVRTGALSRFGKNSLSLRTKPKLWGNKNDRAESRDGTEANAFGELLPAVETADKNDKPDKLEKKSSLFGLGRKAERTDSRDGQDVAATAGAVASSTVGEANGKPDKAEKGEKTEKRASRFGLGRSKDTGEPAASAESQAQDAAKPDKADKKTSRFSLGRKKSGILS